MKSRSMIRTSVGLLVPLVFLACVQGGGSERQRSSAGTADEVQAASPEIRDQFGRLVGDWDILQWRMDSTGVFSPDPLPARWTFRYALAGHAVQDYWIEPPPGQPPPTGTERQYGTNLRAYDAANDVWNIVWTSSDDPGLSIYTAERRGDELVMVGDHEGQRASRIVYSDITEDAFRWRLEFRTEEGWLTVSRIEATRRTDARPGTGAP